MSRPTPSFVPAPGSCYRLVVDSAPQAAELIREKFGQRVQVRSVREVPRTGWRRLLARSRLEVVVQIPGGTAPAGAATPEPAALPRSDEAIADLPAPARPEGALATLLRRGGFSDILLARLGTMLAWPELEAQPLPQGLARLAAEFRRRTATRPARPLPLRAAFFGPAGAGRTSALCKHLAGVVFRRHQTGRVVAVELDRPNPTEQLAVFCEALGVPFLHHPAELVPSDDAGFVFFDLPAVSLRAPALNAGLGRLLAAERIEGRVLVLNAAYDPATLGDAYAAGCDLGATHLVFTHLDEVARWGRLWDYVLGTDLEPLFFSTGPSLTGDCDEDALTTLLQRTLPAVPAATAAERPLPALVPVPLNAAA